MLPNCNGVAQVRAAMGKMRQFNGWAEEQDVLDSRQRDEIPDRTNCGGNPPRIWRRAYERGGQKGTDRRSLFFAAADDTGRNRRSPQGGDSVNQGRASLTRLSPQCVFGCRRVSRAAARCAPAVQPGTTGESEPVSPI